jgi:hypothetical protein
MRHLPLPDLPVDEFARDRSPCRDDDPRIVYVEADEPFVSHLVSILCELAVLLVPLVLLSAVALLAARLLW